MSLSPGHRLGPYEIVTPLGAGGMGEVYRARDTRLGRDVAIKILPPAFAADPESIRRFEKEARAVASLSHPNVVPLFDVGEQDGVRYAVAELVDGETLRARLAGGALSPREASEIAAQLAQGLAAAHDKGIVHRDIKPENIVLTPAGTARILDFGLAKRSDSEIAAGVLDEEPTRSALLTEPGVIAGTVGYMSPEQVRGEPVDGRSDIFSLGVVLWEMLTGSRPFRGGSQIETLNAILKEEPPSDPTLAGLPPELERIVRRCLEKRRENRYHSAADLGHDLRGSVSSPTLSAVRPTAAPRRRARAAWGIGALAAALALVAVFLVLRTRPETSPGLPRTLAVLPFRAIGADTAGEHFGLGLADSLIGRLAGIRELTVRPTSAIARYETAPANAADVGRALRVDAVLEGTYQKLEGMTRVSVQMTDVGRAALLWSDRIDLPEGRLFELQDAISQRIVEKLELQLEPQTKRMLETSQPVPDRAIEQYLSARVLLRDVASATPQRRTEIVAVFDRILAEQPDFARAIGARAYARAWLAFVVPSPENHRAALADAERALSLDPELAEPRVARASVAWSSLGGWDVVTAVRELSNAIARAPNLEIAHLDLARIYIHCGWTEEARRETGAALRLHPFGEARRMAASATTWLEGASKGLEELRRLSVEVQFSWAARWQLLWARAVVEDPARVLPDAEALVREAPRSEPAFAAVLAVVRARSGQPTADLEQRIAEADRRLGHFHHVLQFLADVRAIQGNAAGSVDLLREASKTGLSCGPCFETDPMLASIRGSAEYAALKGELARRDAEYRAALKGVL
ncbi:MAG: protein kinase [Acidobacteriota bacterium]|nr:protein kinase [Acidobacteriota bacterium]MDQ5872431.1 protein kinase [Acidobacteriota bacterium]